MSKRCEYDYCPHTNTANHTGFPEPKPAQPVAPELDHPCRETCSGWRQGYDRGRADVMEQAEALAGALEKIADPRKRDHKEPDAYTTLGCVMHIANEAAERWAAWRGKI